MAHGPIGTSPYSWSMTTRTSARPGPTRSRALGGTPSQLAAALKSGAPPRPVLPRPCLVLLGMDDEPDERRGVPGVTQRRREFSGTLSEASFPASCLLPLSPRAESHSGAHWSAAGAPRRPHRSRGPGRQNSSPAPRTACRVPPSRSARVLRASGAAPRLAAAATPEHRPTREVREERAGRCGEIVHALEEQTHGGWLEWTRSPSASHHVHRSSRKPRPQRASGPVLGR